MNSLRDAEFYNRMFDIRQTGLDLGLFRSKYNIERILTLPEVSTNCSHLFYMAYMNSLGKDITKQVEGDLQLKAGNGRYIKAYEFSVYTLNALRCEPQCILMAMDIPLIGIHKSTELCNYFGNRFDTIYCLPVEQLINVDNIGITDAKMIREYFSFKDRRDEYQTLTRVWKYVNNIKD